MSSQRCTIIVQRHQKLVYTRINSQCIPLTLESARPPKRRMSSDQLSAAERSIPPFLITQNPDALADKLLPTLQEPWPAGTEEALARRAKNTAQTIMNGTQLPLLQSPQVVQCPTCHRVLLRDVFEAHQRTCATLPVAELLEAEINFELHGGRSQTKSPLRDQMGGRSSTGVPRRSPVENGVGNIPGLDPVALTNFPTGGRRAACCEAQPLRAVVGLTLGAAQAEPAVR